MTQGTRRQTSGFWDSHPASGRAHDRIRRLPSRIALQRCHELVPVAARFLECVFWKEPSFFGKELYVFGKETNIWGKDSYIIAATGWFRLTETMVLTQPACFQAHNDEASTQPTSVVSINH